MTTIRRWSPSRISDAITCGRRLQAYIEKWDRGPDQINGVRGGAVHEAIAGWEIGHRQDDPTLLVTNAWLHKAAGNPAVTGLITGAASTLDLSASIAVEEDRIYRELEAQGKWKNIRATNEWKTQTGFLNPDREYVAKLKADLVGQEAQLQATGEIPWQVRRSFLEEGYFHSYETVRRGIDLVAGLYPKPDIMGLEWELEAPLGAFELHGFIDRVELSVTDGAIEVVDYKSSQYEETPLDHFVQSATYAVLASHRIGLPVERVRFAYLRDQKSIAYRVLPEWPERLLSLVTQADARAAAEAFAPSFNGCGICTYRGICEAEFQMTPIDESEAA